MGNMIFEESNKIISHYVEEFYQTIDKENSIDNKAIHPEKTDFPIFRLANEEFFKYQFHERKLEWKIRDFLVTGIIQSLFESEIVSPHTTLYSICDKKTKPIRFSFSKTCFGEEYPFAFIIETENDRIGIRYSDSCKDEKHLKKQLSRYKISHIEVIDWSDTDAIDSKYISCYRKEPSKTIQFLTLKQFFIKYFSCDIFDLYLTEVRKAVNNANNKIGYQTIPALSLRYVSDFRTECLKNLKDICISNVNYNIFDDNGLVTSSVSELIPESDYEIMNKKFYEDALYTVLVGDEDFARCFLTAEYLYNVFKTGLNISFDYTSIVTGYFKSVELLLYRIAKIWLNDNMHQGLWIAGGKTYIAKDARKDWCRMNPEKTGKPQVKFQKEYERHFSTEMGALIWLIHDNPIGWLISDEGKTIVHNNLINYNQGCRNDYLHKDIIIDPETVEYIRNNTLLCLYYLLGGCNIASDSLKIKEVLVSGDTSYEQLYKKLLNAPNARCYIIQLSNEAQPFKAMKLINQSPTKYDNSGKIITPIKFILIDDYSETLFTTDEEYNSLVSSHMPFELNKNNIPYKICLYSRIKGEIPIDW